MNETLIIPNFTNLNVTPYGLGNMDCRYIGTQFCNHLSGNIDSAIWIMGIGILLQMSRKWLSLLALKVPQIAPIANYLDTSILPELFIVVGFLFMAFIRFGGA